MFRCYPNNFIAYHTVAACFFCVECVTTHARVFPSHYRHSSGEGTLPNADVHESLGGGRGGFYTSGKSCYNGLAPWNSLEDLWSRQYPRFTPSVHSVATLSTPQFIALPLCFITPSLHSVILPSHFTPAFHSFTSLPRFTPLLYSVSVILLLISFA